MFDLKAGSMSSKVGVKWISSRPSGKVRVCVSPALNWKWSPVSLSRRSIRPVLFSCGGPRLSLGDGANRPWRAWSRCVCEDSRVLSKGRRLGDHHFQRVIELADRYRILGVHGCQVDRDLTEVPAPTFSHTRRRDQRGGPRRVRRSHHAARTRRLIVRHVQGWRSPVGDATHNRHGFVAKRGGTAPFGRSALPSRSSLHPLCGAAFIRRWSGVAVLTQRVLLRRSEDLSRPTHAVDTL